jgi:glycerophosphoryl diester phosphodiesterase
MRIRVHQRPSAVKKMYPLCVAHRGASAEAPENTLLAFARALELGVDGIELDVQVTRDGVAVIFHDSTLTRLTGTRGRLTDRTWAELKKLRVQAEPIPTLADALSLTRKRAILQIEIKKGAPVAPVLAAIRKTASIGNVILASFEHDILREAAALAPKLPRMLISDQTHLTTKSAKLTKEPPIDPAATHHSSLVIRNSSFALHLLRAMSSASASGISLCHEAITSPLFVETIHRHGAQLWCWTVDDVRTMKRLRDYAVDAILTNDPAKLVKTLRA